MIANDRSYDYDLILKKQQAANNANLRIVAATNGRLFLAKNKQSASSNHFLGGPPVGRLIHPCSWSPIKFHLPSLQLKKQPPVSWTSW